MTQHQTDTLDEICKTQGGFREYVADLRSRMTAAEGFLAGLLQRLDSQSQRIDYLESTLRAGSRSSQSGAGQTETPVIDDSGVMAGNI